MVGSRYQKKGAKHFEDGSQLRRHLKRHSQEKEVYVLYFNGGDRRSEEKLWEYWESKLDDGKHCIMVR